MHDDEVFERATRAIRTRLDAAAASS
jgi:hypothetical protein